MTDPDREHSGRLWIDGDTLRYRSSFFHDFDCAIGDIVLIGEWTTDGGPWLDDWFIVFALRGGTWVDASVSAEGYEDVMAVVCERLGATLRVRLHRSTDFASVVLWPEALDGEPLFSFTPAPPKGLWQRVFGSGEFEFEYTDEVRRELGLAD